MAAASKKGGGQRGVARERFSYDWEARLARLEGKEALRRTWEMRRVEGKMVGYVRQLGMRVSKLRKKVWP